MTKLYLSKQPSRRQLLQLAMGVAGMGVMGTVLTACSNAGPTYYTLTSIPGKVYLQSPTVIEVRSPSLAGFLDKDRIVSEISNNQLTISAAAAWGENLATMMGRVIMLDLAQRLPNSRVFLQNQATQTTPQAYVEIDVSRFNQDVAGKAVVTADLVIRAREDRSARFSRLLTLEKEPANSSIQALVVALSQILGEIADIAAANLTNLPILSSALSK
ncbi:PqiC family protein [Commensalibacter oyaizuii]|uniref:PqiC family protein n=1 Tax=Commensalibacter oyaizuii TaxID=3043873 RepID=A0ABT6Q1K3_9PROT|nr:PqiC family protein [Commensalibacter sp. TBRC 16381]MDI2090994.1 PqiC family protein [Commensalibacter sp. TBRC 16381]